MTDPVQSAAQRSAQRYFHGCPASSFPDADSGPAGGLSRRVEARVVCDGSARQRVRHSRRRRRARERTGADPSCPGSAAWAAATLVGVTLTGAGAFAAGYFVGDTQAELGLKETRESLRETMEWLKLQTGA